MDKRELRGTNSRIMGTIREEANRAKGMRKDGSRAGSSLASGSFSRFGGHSRMSQMMGSKTNLASLSRKNLASESIRQLKSEIFDENGIDVTPLPMVLTDQNLARKNQGAVFGDQAATPLDSVFQSVYGGSFAGSMAQPFSRSVLGSVAEGGATSTPGSFSDIMQSPVSSSKPVQSDIQREDTKEPEILTEADLEKDVDLYLKETDTIWMLDIPGTWVAKESEEAAEVTEKNAKYKELIKTRAGNDRFVPREMQTINNPPKNKDIQTIPVVTKEVGVLATTWDMYDTYEALKETQQEDSQDDVTAASRASATPRTESRNTVSRMSIRPDTRMTAVNNQSVMGGGGNSMLMSHVSTMISTYESTEMLVGGTGRTAENMPDPTQPNDNPILKSDELVNSLRIAERAVTQNVHQDKQALYRGLPVLPDPDKVSTGELAYTLHKPHLELLWQYTCKLTKGRPALCMTWNKLNMDILAVGYGTKKSGTFMESEGLICCWSLKNLEHPERIFRASSPVTSLSFSINNPNLLAAGLFDGTVAIYNVRSTNPDSALDSRDAAQKHSGPVWQVEWVEKERSMGEDKSEVLVSIGADGRLTQWSIRKGFDSISLMRLKRVLQPAPVSEKKTSVMNTTSTRSKHSQQQQQQHQSHSGEAIITTYSPGLSFNFYLPDTNIYLAATEDGLIHKCSCSYNEQYLDTYEGHTGPVYKVTWSPFVSDLFLTCSADWTTRLWHQDNTSPILTFHSAQKAIYDVSWCTWNSTIFGCVCEGRVEIWDLTHSVLDPFVVHRPVSGQGVQHTCIKFTGNAEIIIVGDEEGNINVYQLKKMNAAPENQIGALLSCIKTNTDNS
ncbi:dynein axonemal intermediate chain 4-like [Dysidea avara]|uniref:dynein axonemal intermediate chain 4-like n=1 Tax=Dysidea avara TaxID=196820 RepID=UPI0033196510